VVAAALAVLVGWTIWCGGAVARVPSAGLAHRGVAGLAALLVLPGAIVAVAMGGVETASAVREGAWLWPLACLAALPQPVAALRRSRAPAWFAWPVAGWNVIALADAVARAGDGLGLLLPDALVPVLHAPRAAWADALGADGLTAPWTLCVPLLVPIWPPRLRMARLVHVTLVAVACVGLGAAVLGGVGLASVPSSYARFGAEPLRERPAGDFAVGATMLGAVAGMPAAAVARGDDLALDLLEVGAVHVWLSARTPRAALDSVGRILDARRRAGALVVVAVRDLPSDAPADSVAVAAIVRRTGATTVVVSGPWESAPIDRLASRITRRAAAARAASRREVQVALAVGVGDARRHAWAAAPGSGLDELVLLLAPSARGADGLGRQLATWSTWIAESGSLRRYWVLGSGGVPAAHGARSQRQAVRGVLAWATSEPQVRGAIVGDVSDHGGFTGLRTAARTWRPAAGTVLQAGRSIRETRTPMTAPAPVDTTAP
jgi:hypothetical protein